MGTVSHEFVWFSPPCRLQLVSVIRLFFSSSLWPTLFFSKRALRHAALLAYWTWMRFHFVELGFSSTKNTMGAIHKMAPVGVCEALLHTGACWMYGWLRAAEKNSPSELYFLLLLLRYGLGWYLQTISVFEELEKSSHRKSSSKIFLFFRIDDNEQCRTQNNGTTLQSGDTDCGCRRQATPSLGFCFPLLSPQKRVTHLAFWLFWFFVCGYWLLSPSFGHLASVRSARSG